MQPSKQNSSNLNQLQKERDQRISERQLSMLAQSRGVLAANKPGTNEMEAPEEVYGGGAAGTSEGEVDAGSRGFVLHAGNSSMGRNNGHPASSLPLLAPRAWPAFAVAAPAAVTDQS